MTRSWQFWLWILITSHEWCGYEWWIHDSYFCVNWRLRAVRQSFPVINRCWVEGDNITWVCIQWDEKPYIILYRCHSDSLLIPRGGAYYAHWHTTIVHLSALWFFDSGSELLFTEYQTTMTGCHICLTQLFKNIFKHCCFIYIIITPIILLLSWHAHTWIHPCTLSISLPSSLKLFYLTSYK